MTNIKDNEQRQNRILKRLPEPQNIGTYLKGHLTKNSVMPAPFVYYYSLFKFVIVFVYCD